MMKYLKNFYHFLGGVSFAIFLISSVTLFVIVGTFLESKTDSHRYAALYTYNHPLFALLLWGFFINILFSSLRRWPFKCRHIPFLITHTGLLMILGGVLIKHYYGIQGSMGIIEGSGSHEIFYPESYVLSIENQNSKAYIDLKSLGDVKAVFPELKVGLAGHTPHSSEIFESWIKGNQGFIYGFPPFEVYQVSDPNLPFSVTTPDWNIIAFQSDQVEDLAKSIYLRHLELDVTPNIPVNYSLDFDFSLVEGFLEPKLVIQAQNETMYLPLYGSEALINKNISTPYLGSLPFTVDLKQKPILLFIQDHQNDLYFFAFGRHGEVYSNVFRSNALTSLMSYDNGYLGYATQLKFPCLSQSRWDKEQASIHLLRNSLDEGIKEGSPLSPPLELLRRACEKNQLNFTETCIAYLADWNRSHQLLHSKIIPEMDWDALPENELKTCYWMAVLFPEIQSHLIQGKDFLELLQEREWPLVEQLQALRQSTAPCNIEEIGPLLTAFTYQLHSISAQLPSINPSEELKPLLFAAYLRLYNITYDVIQPQPTLTSNLIELECPLTTRHQKETPSEKLEDNLPMITLALADESSKDIRTLTYDRYGRGLKWPILNGKYLLRFQPKYISIPYHVRLHHARQINYSNSSQPYSFESDLIITDRRDHSSVEKTISMNHVHETWDGYRFYLASITPPTENAVKQIQIVVNHDPAKYILTYPGAIILTIGIILLFWLKKDLS